MIKAPEKKAQERKALRMLLLISQVGICMMVPVFFCLFVGRWVAERTGHPLVFLLFLLTGVLAGFRSCWQVIARFTGLKADRLFDFCSGDSAGCGHVEDIDDEMDETDLGDQ